MQLSSNEIELIKKSIELSIETFNQIPVRYLKKKKVNKVLIVNQYNELLKNLEKERYKSYELFRKI